MSVCFEMPKSKKRARRRTSSTSSSSSSSSSSGLDSPPQLKQNRKINKKSKSNSKEKSVSNHQCSNSYNAQSNSTITISSIIPEYDPMITEIKEWIEIIEHNARTYEWPDHFIIYQALNKLKNTAKTWYDSFIESERGWSNFSWERWRTILSKTFQSTRNTYELFMDIANHKPKVACSLYEFHFHHLAKINKLRLNFSDSDKVSLIIGAINDDNLTSAVEASNITDPNVLAGYLKNKSHKSPKLSNVTIDRNKASSSHSGIKQPQLSKYHNSNIFNIICKACGENGHYRRNCKHRDKLCNFCSKKGHIEKHCYKKNDSHKYSQKTDINKHARRLEKTENVRQIKKCADSSKFYKTGFINKHEYKVFVDFGSDCSLISMSLAKKFSLQIKHLQSEVKLSGFLGVGINVTQYSDVCVKIDNVELKINIYVIDDSRLDTNVLIGRNFTENKNIIYYRIDDTLTFKYRVDNPEWIGSIKHGTLSASEKESLTYFNGVRRLCF